MSVKVRIVVIVGIAVAGGTASLLSSCSSEGAPETLTLYGNVDIREVDLGFRVGGRLTEMTVDEGDRVETGQTVARIDDEPYREALATAEARVARARAQLDKLERGTRPEEVRQARAQVRQAKAAFENARTTLQRYRTLAESGAVSQQDLDAAQTRHEETSAALASARNALALAVEGPRSEDIAAAEAQLATAVAQREEAETRVGDTVLTAPSDATVLTRVREPGAMLGPGAPVYTLSLRDPVYVRAYVSEPNLGKISPGAKVTVTTDSSDRVYEGTVGFISPRAEFTPKSVETTELRTDLVYRLRIVVHGTDEGLRQGMPVTVNVSLTSGGPEAPEDD